MTEEKILAAVKSGSEYADIQARVYRDKEQIAYFSERDFGKDCVSLHLDRLLSVDEKLSTLFTEEQLFYIVMKVDNYTAIVGPASEIPIDKKNAEKMAGAIGCNKEEKAKFVENLLEQPHNPIATLLLMASYAYYQLTGERLDPSELYKMNSNSPEVAEAETDTEKSIYELDETRIENEALYDFERKLLKAIKTGQESEIDKLYREMSISITPKANMPMRHFKNIFIIATTVISRAVIESGIAVADSYALSDYYINWVEKLEQPDQTAFLLVRMIKDYTRKLGEMKVPVDKSELVYEVNTYIQKHISERISVNEMADELGMSRNTLSGRFKKEAGFILSDYILDQKIDKAKSLIAMTDYSMAEISSYLAFSSQSHFQRTFKKIVGETPSEYKRMHYFAK